MTPPKKYFCPWCPDLFFFTPQDLTAHLKAGKAKIPPVNAPAINKTDHLHYYQKIHLQLERGT